MLGAISGLLSPSEAHAADIPKNKLSPEDQKKFDQLKEKIKFQYGANETISSRDKKKLQMPLLPSHTTYNDVQTIKSIQKHEGYRSKPYKDTEGYWTVGYGHRLGKKKPTKMSYTKAESDALFQKDYKSVMKDYRRIGVKLDPVRESVIKEMIFNLGLVGLSEFDDMWTAIGNKNYKEAAMEMLNSKWHKQVKGRAETLARRMQTGKF